MPELCPDCGSILENGKCSSMTAFGKAIEAGRLSMDKAKPNYVGRYMFMGTHDGKDLFKNKLTRKYDV